MEANIAGDLRIRSWGSPLEIVSGQRRWMAQIYATALFRLRMLREPGSPIPAPSFMPKATIQFVTYGESANGDRVSLNIFNLVPYAHHSNGQSGCPLEGQVRPSSDMPCIRPSLLSPSAQLPINVGSGDFSTNYMKFGYYRKEIFFSSLGPVDYTLLYGGEYEHHTDIFPGGLHGDLQERYGMRRLNLVFGVAIEHPVSPVRPAQLTVRLGRIFGVERDPWTVAPEIVYYPGWLTSLGVYAKVHLGRDYYNINFENTLARTEIGLTFTWDRLDRIFEL